MGTTTLIKLPSRGFPETTYFQGRKILISSQNRICLGPCIAESKDIIVIFLGGKVPYVLRPLGDDFIFIGEW
jgi:hypothetical protein